MSDINSVTLIGRLTKDPEIQQTQSGSMIARLSIANNETWTQNGQKQEKVSFFDCSMWGKLAEVVKQYCKKGMQVAISGKLQQQKWQNNNGQTRSKIEIVANSVQFLGGANNNGNNQDNYNNNGNYQQGNNYNSGGQQQAENYGRNNQQNNYVNNNLQDDFQPNFGDDIPF